MVKIAIAGGSGQVAREVIDAILAEGSHEVTVLSRNESSTATFPPSISLKVVNYNAKEDLVMALTGVHTLLSFVQLLSDPDQTSQKNLIDAAIVAGVKRFAPSEYGSTGLENMPWWAGKQQIREYLQSVNEQGNVLEYTLFQPGLFLDYLAYPYKTAKYLDPLQTVIDFQSRRAILVEGHEDTVLTLTAVADLAEVIVRAIADERRWPVISGIQGNKVTFSEIVAIGAKVRGQQFQVDKVLIEDLEAGLLKTSWNLEAVHQAVDEAQASAMLKAVSIGILLSSTKGAWDISNEMNQRFTDHQFRSAEQFLDNIWSGKP